MNAESLALMSATDRERYAQRLESWAGDRRSRLAEFLRAAARIARNEWSYT